MEQYGIKLLSLCFRMPSSLEKATDPMANKKSPTLSVGNEIMFLSFGFDKNFNPVQRRLYF
jgi:hypothetical protein